MALGAVFQARFARAAEAIAAAAPFVLAVLRAADSSQWRDDVAMARGLGLVASPGAGLVTTLGLQLALLVPIGPRTYRGALVAALALALVSWLVFRLCRRILDDVIEGPILSPALACAAALTACLSPALQREATVAGGATVAVALALAALTVAAERRAGGWSIAIGALAGALLLESPVAALVVSLALVVRATADRRAVGPRFVFVGLAGVLAFVALPLALRHAAPRAWLDLGASLRPRDLVPLDVAALRSRGISAWVTDIGPLALALTAIGALAGALRRWAWPAIAPLGALLLADLLVPASSAGVLGADPCAAVRALAVVAAAVLSALGVQAVVTTLLASRLTFARPAAILLVALDVALAAVAAEESSLSADREGARGAEEWTTAALERLPPTSLLLVRSDAATWRAWTARLAAGVRPDVTVVPLPLLVRGRLAAALLADEPALAPLLRDLSATGGPTEHALSSLADVRPLYVELDPAWDRRLAVHLVADKLWLRYAPQPLGTSDRKLAEHDDAAPIARVIAAADRADAADDATLEVLSLHTREQLLAATLVGDRDAARAALVLLASFHREPPAGDPIWAIVDPQRKPEPRAGARARAR